MKTFFTFIITLIMTVVIVVSISFTFVSTSQYHEWRKEWQTEVIDRAKNIYRNSVASIRSFGLNDDNISK